VLGNLFELYLHDMSEAFPLELGADGRVGHQGLPSYFAEPDRRFPLWIRRDGARAGNPHLQRVFEFESRPVAAPAR
jgi:predicted acetyltransferase